jgi:hypothetical protein
MSTVSTTVNFVSQYQHELSDNEEEGELPVDNELIGDTNHLTTISLPSDEAWRNATAKEHGLHLVMEAVRSGEPLDKKKLRKKMSFTSTLHQTLTYIHLIYMITLL